MTIDDIAHGTNSTLILFDGEEEEFLPPALQQLIPEKSNNNEDCVALTPPDNPDPTFNHNNLNDPDSSSNHGDLIDHQDQNVSVKPWRSNHQKRGPNETSKLERAVQEVRMSVQRKWDEKAEKQKNLADIREEERQNKLKQVEEEARRNLGDLDNPLTLPKISDQVLPSEELHDMFKNLSIHDEADITHRHDTILLAVDRCSALSAQHLAMDAPKNWEEAQKQPEAAEWKTVIDEELKSLKDMGAYKLIQRSELPHNAKVRKGLIILTNKIDANRYLVRRKAHFVFKGYKQ